MAKYSEELLQASEKASAKYNIPVSVILGFAGNETSFGTAGKGKSKNNLFGIGNKSYDSIEDSVDDFASLVTGNKDSAQSKKYGQATANASTPEQWVTAITNAGYNSVNPNYIDDTMSVITSHNLTSLDSSTGRVSGGRSGESFRNSQGLTWWGDIVVVIFSLLLVVGGIIFLGLSVKETTGIKLKLGGGKLG